MSRNRVQRASVLLLLGAIGATTAYASQTVSGTYLKVSYNTNSSWNYSGKGLQVDLGGTWYDFTYPGTPWQYNSLTYKKGASVSSYYAYYTGATWTSTSEANTSSGSYTEATYSYTAGDLSITRVETWETDSRVMQISYTVENTGSSTLTDVRTMFGIDPDQDITRGTYNTYNDVIDTDGDGVKEYAQSVGPITGHTVGFGACDPSTEYVGHNASWSTSTSATYTDYGGSSGDYTVHWLHVTSSLAAGAVEEIGFVITVDVDAASAKTAWTDNMDDLCDTCHDRDGDGHEDSSCGGDDCDDGDASNYPGADEVCDGDDNDCDGSVDEGAIDIKTWYPDDDGDGYGDVGGTPYESCEAPEGYASNADDCDDGDAAINPGVDELCDGIDNDCDTYIDEADAVDKPTWYRDADGDAYGDSGTTRDDCDMPSGYVSNDLDCDDADSLVSPAADELCDSIDNDCDGEIDEDSAVDAPTWWRDRDRDTFGNPADSYNACSEPSGYVGNDEDCDDSSSVVSPDATEVCNGFDDDCDGAIDEGDSIDGATWYRDLDGDTYGDVGTTAESCTQPSGYVSNPDDCDDRTATINPAGIEVCNSLDDDCDGVVDDGAGDAAVWYVDADGDEFGSASLTAASCDQPEGYVANIDDCDDSDASVNPAATELPYDSIDQDCDGLDLSDVDEDGYDASFVGGTDCDDSDASIYPGAMESADGVDEDCNGSLDDGTAWGDDDGDGVTESGGDCDDADGSIYPGNLETADSIDNDCDGTIDEGTTSYDDDGDGYSEEGGDCVDSDVSIHPGAVEVADNGIDDDCDGMIDDGSIDDDGDGFGDDVDCAPDDPTTNPGAAEVDNGQDDDCDGEIDEGTTGGDDDGDGQSEDDGDCDDTDPTVSIGAEETPNGRDDDCDGQVDEDTTASDDDGDGLSEDAGDCDDADADVHPGADEVASNGIDDDCDGDLDEASTDGDADGYAVLDGDCDDQNGWVHPGLDEMCDGLDNNCDGEVDEGDVCADESAVTGDTGDTGKEGGGGTCGCSSNGASGSSVAALLGLAALLRRRRA